MSVMPPITLGDVSVRPVVGIPRSSFATTSMLPDSTADAVARHHRWLRPHFWDEGTNDLGSRIQSFVVKTPRTTVLIDTCVGNDKNREGSALWHMRRGAFLDDLAVAASLRTTWTSWCARICTWITSAGTRDGSTAAGCRPFRGRRTSSQARSGSTGATKRTSVS